MIRYTHVLFILWLAGIYSISEANLRKSCSFAILCTVAVRIFIAY